MRRFMMSALTISSASRRTTIYHRHGSDVFGGNSTAVLDNRAAAASLQDGGRVIRCLPNCKTTTKYTSDDEPKMSVQERDNAIKIQVISKDHIKPSSPTPQNLRYYKLSIFDQIQMSIYYPFTFFYPNNDHNKSVEEIIRDRSNHLRRSLSETLTRFYPFAGKVASELHIDCNDDGVYFIETRVDEMIKNVLKTPDNKFLQRLIPVVDSIPNQPLLGSYVSMVQVNFFNCGGVAITVQHNHKLVDGSSYMLFMKAWSAIARRDLNQLVHPSFITSSMYPQISKLPSSPYIPIWYLTISPAFLKPGKCATKRFVFDALALRELKAKASKHQPVNRIVAVLALLWKCIITETQSKPSILHLPVNIRPQSSLPFPESAVGNFLLHTHATFVPNSNDLDVASIAGQLKNAIAAVNGKSVEELKGENGNVKYVESLRNSMETFSDYNTDYYHTTSLCNSGTKKFDFGWGKPIWSCTNNLNEDIPIFMNRMVMMDSCSGDGIEVWVTVEEKVMNAVTCNPELLSYASVDPSPI